MAQGFGQGAEGYQLKPGQVDRTRDWAVVTTTTASAGVTL
jgi:hypothetical protein